jgi:putative transposase
MEKSIIERVNQYFKDRTESFDDYYPCIKNNCKMIHIYNWIHFYVSMYNDLWNNKFKLGNYGDEFILN